MQTRESHGAWCFLQPEGLAVLGTKVYRSGKASQRPPATGAPLTLKRQRRDLGCSGGKSRDFSFIPYSSHLSLSPLPWPHTPHQALGRHLKSQAGGQTTLLVAGRR